MNAEKLERFASIPEEERRLAEGLLFDTPPVNVPVDHPNAALLGVPTLDGSLQEILTKVPEGRASAPMPFLANTTDLSVNYR